MRIVREVVLGERRVSVRELTVGEIRAWLKSLATLADGDAVDAALFSEITLFDLTRLSDLSADEIDRLTPSELRQVIDAAKEVNADFFGMRARLLALVEVPGATDQRV